MPRDDYAKAAARDKGRRALRSGEFFRREPAKKHRPAKRYKAKKPLPKVAKRPPYSGNLASDYHATMTLDEARQSPQLGPRPAGVRYFNPANYVLVVGPVRTCEVPLWALPLR